MYSIGQKIQMDFITGQMEYNTEMYYSQKTDK